ncbi:AraC family transcriptional regulator [Actinoplanes sp. TRM 88003]|uniref:AraC family transcriptional regulator n=1 Tax=Paractinoplanes aksuensis TaxID=2939490 RepID=A0ABT1DGE5_9ACTN|nr:AraC family transcriptional regulator [Actinoplanes aksuensis]MCO8269563.1 AraC family transcriptional regulator [Actinoplanes aksuensis]
MLRAPRRPGRAAHPSGPPAPHRHDRPRRAGPGLRGPGRRRRGPGRAGAPRRPRGDAAHRGRTVRAIAEKVGWPDQNYFARRFRAHYGLTATEYRTRFTRGIDLGSVRRPPPPAATH